MGRARDLMHQAPLSPTMALLLCFALQNWMEGMRTESSFNG